MSLEYYNGTTDRLLFKQNTMSFSGSNQFWNNIGKVRNQGFELELTSNNIRRKNLEWITMFNIRYQQEQTVGYGRRTLPIQLW